MIYRECGNELLKGSHQWDGLYGSFSHALLRTSKMITTVPLICDFVWSQLDIKGCVLHLVSKGTVVRITKPPIQREAEISRSWWFGLVGLGLFESTPGSRRRERGNLPLAGNPALQTTKWEAGVLKFPINMFNLRGGEN